MKTAWLFGQSSNFSKQIISELKNQHYDTTGFGRSNVDYSDFDTFIQGKQAPNVLILNYCRESRIVDREISKTVYVSKIMYYRVVATKKRVRIFYWI